MIIFRTPGRPTPEQAVSGNYAKPTLDWHGLTIAIENPEGTVREGVDETGKPWRTVFRFAYGEFLWTCGVDGDPVDVYVGQYAEATEVYVVRQMKRKKWDQFDEDKCFVNFRSMDDARDAYLEHYDDPRFYGGVIALPVAEFITKVRATKTKPDMIKAIFIKTRQETTEPTRELIAEHEHLVDVLRSPSHEDDKEEAEKQADELAEYKKEAVGKPMAKSIIFLTCPR